MRLRFFRVVPAAVAVELAAGLLDEPKQIADLHARNLRWCRIGGRRPAQRQNDAQDPRGKLHSSRSSGSSAKSLTFSRCQALRAGSFVYSTMRPSTSVRHTKRTDFPDA